jgi:hypothetical protein
MGNAPHLFQEVGVIASFLLVCGKRSARLLEHSWQAATFYRINVKIGNFSLTESQRDRLQW